MKRFFLSVVLATTLALTSCQFDDSDIWGKLDEYGESIRDHEQRISALEELCKQMNTNIEALQTLVDALEKRDYVTNVSEVRSNGEVIGYTISFAYSDTITIYHGKDGQDGANGADGKDGYTPQIGVMKDTDNIYYWTLDGEWLLDGKGNKIQANGVNGTNGTNGTNGVTPQLKIENDYWYVSYDNGATWEKLGNASSGSGSSNCVITNVEESETEVVFTLADGSTITLPKGEKAEVVSENNKIYYTTTDGKKLFPYSTEPSVFGAILISNTYEDGQGVLTFDDEITVIGEMAFVEYCDRLATIKIPDSVISIEENAFQSCSELVAFYGKFASTDNYCLIVDGVLNSFAHGCGLNEYTIPDSVTSIGERAFKGCTSLMCISIPNSVTSIRDRAFYNCTSLTSIIIPNSITSIGDCAFQSCTGELIIQSKIIENPTTDSAFGCHRGWLSGAEFTKLTIGNNITKIGDQVFIGCRSLVNVTIPNSITEIGRSAFEHCVSLTSITIPDSVTSIGYYAFYNCTLLTSVTIGNSVTSIGSSAFSGCKSLTSVTIPDSVTEIGDAVFRDCTSLNEVYCKSITPPTGGADMFYHSASECKIYVPTASVNAYKTADGWSNYAYSIVGYDF